MLLVFFFKLSVKVMKDLVEKIFKWNFLFVLMLNNLYVLCVVFLNEFLV